MLSVSLVISKISLEYYLPIFENVECTTVECTVYRRLTPIVCIHTEYIQLYKSICLFCLFFHFLANLYSNKISYAIAVLCVCRCMDMNMLLFLVVFASMLFCILFAVAAAIIFPTLFSVLFCIDLLSTKQAQNQKPRKKTDGKNSKQKQRAKPTKALDMSNLNVLYILNAVQMPAKCVLCAL